jgi:hypothetical protein
LGSLSQNKKTGGNFLSNLLTEIKEALIEYTRNVDVILALESCRGFTFEQQGGVYHCHQHDGLVVENDRISWHWQSNGASGRGILDYLMNAENMSFREAIDVLANMDVGESPTD